MARVLIIDDEIDWLRYLQKLLQAAGHEVCPLNKPDGTIEAMQRTQPDIVVTDILMPGISGGTVYAQLRNAIGAALPIIVCSSTRLNIKVSDLRMAYCMKSDAGERLLPAIEQMLESSNSAQANQDAITNQTQERQA